MKYLMTAFLIFYSMMFYAQSAKNILGIARENKTAAYYQEQIIAWDNVISKNEKDYNAWIQLYRANRAFIQKSDQERWRNDRESVYEELQTVITRAEKAIPNSFELYYLKSKNTDEIYNNIYLDKAYAIDPDREIIYNDLLIKYYYHQNIKGLKSISKKILDRNIFSAATLSWNYNSLASAPTAGVFFTNGDMDTMPKWVLQYGTDFNQDLKVVNRVILASQEKYREALFTELDISLDIKSIDDFNNLSDYADYLMNCVATQSNMDTYFQCGTDVQFFRHYNLEDQIYLVGLAYKYSKRAIPNEKMTVDLYENDFLLDNISNPFQRHENDEIVSKYMNITYLPSLTKCYHFFRKAGNTRKTAYYKALMYNIGTAADKLNLVESYLNE